MADVEVGRGSLVVVLIGLCAPGQRWRDGCTVDGSDDCLDVLLALLVVEILDAPFCMALTALVQCLVVSTMCDISPQCVVRRVLFGSGPLGVPLRDDHPATCVSVGMCRASLVQLHLTPTSQELKNLVHTWNSVLLKLFCEPWPCCQYRDAVAI